MAKAFVKNLRGESEFDESLFWEIWQLFLDNRKRDEDDWLVSNVINQNVCSADESNAKVFFKNL